MKNYPVLNMAGLPIGNMSLDSDNIPNFMMNEEQFNIYGGWVVEDNGKKTFRNFFLAPAVSSEETSSSEIPFSVNWYRGLNEIKRTVFVAMLLQNHDGSGIALVLGAYLTKTEAEARCYRELQKLDYLQATAVVDCVLGVDLETVHSRL